MAGNLKEFFSGIKQNWSKNKLLLWGLGLAGVLMLILPGSCQPKENPMVDMTPEQGNYQQQLQHELESILASIEGAGKVRVMLTLDDEQETVYARNEEESKKNTIEEDSQGGVREQLEYDQSGQLVIVRTNNQEQPVVIKIIKPQVRGVLVVAEGAGNALICQRLTHAVQAVLDVPAYKITVQKGR